jgi:1,4-alpha-glucan branching enzyme
MTDATAFASRPATPSSATAPPAPPGMGATVHAGGTCFRVWAPNAQAVSVKGDFNGWDDTVHPLQRDDSGHWAIDIPGVGAGAGYTFHLVGADGQARDRIDPQARQVTNSVGVGLVVDPAAFDWQGDAYTLPSHDQLVIYELHVGSFNAPEPGQPGNFDTVMARLDHLQQLGVNVVQLMPVAEFAGDYSWGYNPAHPFAVETAYGGPDGLKTLVREAHRRGIGVVLDVVYNHFGPSDLDLWQFDGWQQDGKGGIYFYNDHRSSTPWGDTRPDYGRPEVRQFIRDNALMWLRDYHLDGLRLDMTLYMRSIGGAGDDDLPDAWALMQWLNAEVRQHHPHAITIAEDLRDHAGITAAPDEGGAGFHAQWDARFVHPVRALVITPDDAQRSMAALREALLFRYNGDAFRRVVYSESHDEVANGQARVPQEIAPDDPGNWVARKRSTLAAALALTAPGIPMLFQGQEFLQAAWFRDDVPLNWAQCEDFRGIVQLYRDLIALRLNRAGHSAGLTGQGCAVTHENEADNLLVIHRWRDGGPGDDVVVVVNLSAQPQENYAIGLPAAGRWCVRLNSDAQAYADDFGNAGPAELTADAIGRDGQPAQAVLSMAPYSVLVLSQPAL